MMDAYQYQKKEKAKQKANKKYNPTDFDEVDYLLWTTFGIMIVFLIVLLVASHYSYEDNLNNCEKLDGSYEVVDKEFAGKTVVDIYGCVK